MWVQAGFSPDSFWDQTPRHFQVAIKAVRRKIESENEARIAVSWQTGVFTSLGQAGKLKPLRHYLKPKSQKQEPREMLAALLAHQANGAPMRISKIRLEKAK